MTNERIVKIRFAPSFRKAVKKLRKKYPHIRDDLDPLITQLTNGETPGDQIQSTGYTVYKVRIPNSDARRGKSGGYRVIYYIPMQDDLILLMIYSKSDQSDISAENVRDLIDDLPDEDEDVEPPR